MCACFVSKLLVSPMFTFPIRHFSLFSLGLRLFILLNFSFVLSTSILLAQSVLLYVLVIGRKGQ